jgi:hypothetical protein
VISATAPASPAVGEMWWDSTGGQLYLWYDDGTSQQWVIANNNFPVAPALATVDELTAQVAALTARLAALEARP